MDITKVLIVEDDPLAGAALASALERPEYQVVGLAATGTGALEVFHKQTPDIILMDIQLEEEMDGIETSRRILATHNIPVVFVSALEDEKTINEAKRVTPYGYILKPYNPGTVHAAIQIALRLFERDREIALARRLLADYARKIETVREEERTRCSRDIHDVLGQKLTAVRMNLSWLKKRMSGEKAEIAEHFAATDELLQEIVDLVKDIAGMLRPTQVLEFGVVQAIRHEMEFFSIRSDAACTVRLTGETTDLSRSDELMLFRIFQEALTNISRHAHPRKVTVSLDTGTEGTVLLVEDDGDGFDEAKLRDRKALGLISMKERAEALSAKLTITTAPGRGTSVRISVPKGSKSDE